MNAEASPDLPRSPAGPYNPWMIVIMLSIAPFMEVLDSTIANVSLTHIAGSLAASQDQSTWVLTSYLVANSIILPISAWLSQVLGRKRFYQICVLLFTLSSVLCAFSTSLTMMIVARCLQGLGGGGLAPVAQSMLADSFVPEKRGQVFALLGFSIIIAPIIGPLLGGWLTDHLSWHWIFLINLPIGLVSLTLVAIFISEPELLKQERQKLLSGGLKLDYLGLFLIALGFGLLQIFLDKFQEDDGFSSPFIMTAFCVVVAALSLLAVWEWHHPQPIMNLRLFLIRNFAIGNIIMFIIGFIMLSSTQLLPQLTQTLLGYNSQTSGEVLALAGLATIIAMPVSGFLTGRYVNPKWLMTGGCIEIGLGLLLQATIAPDVTFGTLALYRIATSIALPFLFVPISAVCYIGIPPKNNGDASALMNQTRNIGGSIGISFVTGLLIWRSQFHHARLAESITPYSSLHGMAVSQIAPLVQNQSEFMSYIDVFRIIGVVALVVWPVILFLRSPPKVSAQGVPVAH